MDDIDASTHETVTFGIDGQDYEIDLSEHDARRLRATFAPYLHAARRVGGRSRRAGRRPVRIDVTETEVTSAAELRTGPTPSR